MSRTEARAASVTGQLHTTGIGGETFVTAGMWAKGAELVAEARAAAKNFYAFTEDNDP